MATSGEFLSNRSATEKPVSFTLQLHTLGGENKRCNDCQEFVIVYSYPDQEFYSKFGSKIGSRAAKLGKKAAQSEAGRSAGKAAVRGATEGARQDLTDRYLRQGEYGDSPGSPKEPKTTSQPSHSSGGTAHRSSST